MHIVILGRGNMGAPFAQLASAAGHHVESFGSRGDALPALHTADLVIFATKYEQALAITGQADVAAALAGRIVVDITNPLTPDYMGLTVGHTSSAAEEIQARLPGVKVVKAFNTVFAALMSLRAAGEPVTVPVFVAGDDGAAVEVVSTLAKAMGFAAVVAGPLSNARYLEPMAELMIQLGYALGHGDRIGFTLRIESAVDAAA